MARKSSVNAPVVESGPVEVDTTQGEDRLLTELQVADLLGFTGKNPKAAAQRVMRDVSVVDYVRMQEIAHTDIRFPVVPESVILAYRDSKASQPARGRSTNGTKYYKIKLTTDQFNEINGMLTASNLPNLENIAVYDPEKSKANREAKRKASQAESTNGVEPIKIDESATLDQLIDTAF